MRRRTGIKTMHYVLVTPMRNEGAFAEKTFQSVTQQTRLPLRWVVVDDGSTDESPEIAARYAAQHAWIKLVRRPRRLERSFAGKVHAFEAGRRGLGELAFDIIGCLDGDVSFEPDYMAFLIEQFEQDERLGVAGTPFLENGYDSARDSFEGENHVAGGVQLFRSKCFEEVGGYVPNRAGGIDWVAVTTARMKGWRTRSFAEKRFHHHRPLGTAERGMLASMFSYGEKDYYLGGSPVWEMFRVTYRLGKRPWVTGGLALGLGYLSAALRRMPRAVTPELMAFHRREQMAKLRSIVGTKLRGERLDNFRALRGGRDGEETSTGSIPVGQEKRRAH